MSRLLFVGLPALIHSLKLVEVIDSLVVTKGTTEEYTTDELLSASFYSGVRQLMVVHSKCDLHWKTLFH
jgi:hypothetical protein